MHSDINYDNIMNIITKQQKLVEILKNRLDECNESIKKLESHKIKLADPNYVNTMITDLHNEYNLLQNEYIEYARDLQYLLYDRDNYNNVNRIRRSFGLPVYKNYDSTRIKELTTKRDNVVLQLKVIENNIQLYKLSPLRNVLIDISVTKSTIKSTEKEYTNAVNDLNIMYSIIKSEIPTLNIIFNTQ